MNSLPTSGFSSDRGEACDEDPQDSGHSILLTIVARGTAIITEIYRLVELIPQPYQQRQHYISKSSIGKDKRYTLDEIVCDFSYFKNADSFEAKIEQNYVLKNADELFCDTYSDILTRFYLTFESIQRYANDLNRFIIDLEEDAFIGQTFETLLLDRENLQLLCEAYFQLGYMLLLVDINFDGDLRERLIISYYRYSSYKSSPSTELDGTCNLMRNTNFKCERQKGYKSGAVGLGSRAAARTYHRPEAYPEKYFARASVDQSVINTLIAKLQIIDVYNQTVAVFPHPNHRSNALSQQASILFILLYFCPNILKAQRSRMREITDKFFCDNWVLDIFMGERVNLIEAWSTYGAAKESLVQILDIETVKGLSDNIRERFETNSKLISTQYLVEGWLNEDTFLENNARILNCIRDSNVILKWILLHSSMHVDWQSFRLIKALHSIVVERVQGGTNLCWFLQNLSVLEKKVNIIYGKLIDVKASKIEDCKLKACETLEELICIFNDSKPMRWVRAGANASLATILQETKQGLQSTDFTALKSRSSVIKTINRIDSARESYSDDKSLQVVQLFMDTKQNLVKALRYLDLGSDMRVILQSVGDFRYAWRVMDEYFTVHLQQTIKNDPISMFGLEAIIIKLAAAFETPLLRLQQVNSHADLVSVSQYYSTKLVTYIREVLQVIPSTILGLMSTIISIQTNNILWLIPPKIHLDSLKDYALPDQRAKMLELTRKISNYAKGMMMLPNTTIGLVKMNSKQILEDGMRRELFEKMSESIQCTLQFEDAQQKNSISGPGAVRNTSLINTAQNLHQKLNTLTAIMNGYERSFEYIQDFLFIYGSRMCQEELSRIIKTNLDQAISALSDDVSLMQCYDTASIDSRLSNQTCSPKSTPMQTHNVEHSVDYNFIVRVLKELLKITNPRETIYDEQTNTWYEQKANHQQVVDLKIFQSIHSSLGVTGLNGLDKLCCSLLMVELQKLNAHMLDFISNERDSTRNTSSSQSLHDALHIMEDLTDKSSSHGNTGTDGSNFRQSVLRAISLSQNKQGPNIELLLNHLLSVGQLQAIRMNINSVLSTKCRYESKNLYGCLEVLNTTLLAALKHGKRSPSQQKSSAAPENPSSNVSKLEENEESNEANQESVIEFTMDQNHSFGLEDSQLIFELTNHLEYVGLSDPMSKIYTFALKKLQQREVMNTLSEGSNHVDYGNAQSYNISCESQSSIYSHSISLIFLLLVEQSSKFYFSRSISGFLPKPTKSFYETSANVDGQPLFYGITTLLNHYQPCIINQINVSEANDHQHHNFMGDTEVCGFGACPLTDLLKLIGIYIKYTLGQPVDGTCIKPRDLRPEIINMTLSVIELSRLARVGDQSAGKTKELPDNTCLPKYIFDTFQSTVCDSIQLN